MMNSRILWVGFCALASFALIPAFDRGLNRAAADDKTAPPPANKDAKKYVDVGKMTGKLKEIKTGSSEGVLEYRSVVGRSARNETMDLTFADEVKVWFVTPPEKIDENGNSRKQTPAELDKIKSRSGPTKGLYAAAMSDLHTGQQVQVILSKPKDAVKKPAAPKDKNAAPEKEFVYVTQVIVTVDEKAPTKPDKKK